MRDSHGNRNTGMLSKILARKRYIAIVATLAVVYILYNFFFIDTLINHPNSVPSLNIDGSPKKQYDPYIKEEEDWGKVRPPADLRQADAQEREERSADILKRQNEQEIEKKKRDEENRIANEKKEKERLEQRANSAKKAEQLEKEKNDKLKNDLKLKEEDNLLGAVEKDERKLPEKVAVANEIDDEFKEEKKATPTTPTPDVKAQVKPVEDDHEEVDPVPVKNERNDKSAPEVKIEKKTEAKGSDKKVTDKKVKTPFHKIDLNPKKKSKGEKPKPILARIKDKLKDTKENAESAKEDIADRLKSAKDKIKEKAKEAVDSGEGQYDKIKGVLKDRLEKELKQLKENAKEPLEKGDEPVANNEEAQQRAEQRAAALDNL